MYAQADMSGRSVHLIMEDIFDILKKEKELSIRQLSIKLGSQWITTKKALNSMKKLRLVSERKGNKTYKEERLFRLK